MFRAFSVCAIPVCAIVMMSSVAARAAVREYSIDTNHSQVTFSFNHHGFSAVTGIVTGIAGDIAFDKEAPAASSVVAKLPLATLTTGHAAEDGDILSPGFLDAKTNPEVSFRSTAIRVVGENRALIEGELTLNGVSAPVTLDTVLNKDGASMKGVPTLGLSATTTLLRSAFNAGRSAPANSDAVEVKISIEATQVPAP